MRRFILLWLAFGLTAVGCDRPPTPSRPRAEPSPAEVGDLRVAAAISYKNLQIFPVVSKTPKSDDRFITLDEGLAAGTVEILEIGADAARVDGERDDAGRPNDPMSPIQPVDEEVAGDVNRLMVLNRSGKPLYLMPGEVIVGGKQDRTIGREGIICSGDEPVPIDVYCVEHGRWAGRGEAEASLLLSSIAAFHDRRAPDEETLNQLANEAKRGKFVVSAGNLSKESRLAVQAGKGQQEVWNEVGAANARANVQMRSGAFTANYADGRVADQLKAYVDELEIPIREQEQVVGVIVATNGKVEAVDVFESTPLFKKLWPKLLRSYALDAANAASAPEAAKACTPDDAEDFLATARKAEVEGETEGEGGLVVTRRSAGGVVSFSAAEGVLADEAGEDAASYGFGGSVHSAAYAQ